MGVFLAKAVILTIECESCHYVAKLDDGVVELLNRAVVVRSRNSGLAYLMTPVA